MNKNLNEVSKLLSNVLRHEPHAIGLEPDRDGWADIDALIAVTKNSGKELDADVIRAVVASSDKKRFAISDDGKRIRAVQGRSTETVAIQREPKQQPEFLYHALLHVSWTQSWLRACAPAAPPLTPVGRHQYCRRLRATLWQANGPKN